MPNTKAQLNSEPSLQIEGSIATIQFNRPSSHNRIEPSDIESLHNHFERIEDMPNVRLVLLTSSGPNFSSGFDLRVLGTDPQRNVREFERLADVIENCSAISVAKLHAPVFGGATDLALACDFRLGVRGIRMFMPAAKLGLHYYPHGLRRWVSRLGLGPAKRLFLTGCEINDDEMLRIGFLDALLDVDEFEARVSEWVSDLLVPASTVQRTMKSALNEACRGEFDAARSYAAFDKSLSSAEVAEALVAFKEKRKPLFR